MTTEFIESICTVLFYGTLSFGAAILILLVVAAMIGLISD